VQTALARVCTTIEQVEDALDAFGPPYVVKADGLAAGKGVVVTSDRGEAVDHARICLTKDAASGAQVVIEEYLDGPEVSLFCLCDGTRVVPLAPAQDFKRVADGDLGPNTGGMGAYSPLPWAPANLMRDVVDRVATPVINEMARRGTPFTGVLYCGLALGRRGMRVIEFNVRFGDPETQVVLARLTTPLAGVLLAAATGALSDLPELTWRPSSAVTVVVAAQGYPAAPRTGDVIAALPTDTADAWVLHAGTARGDDGVLRSSGGRVLSVVGTGSDLGGARAAAYRAVDAVDLTGSHHRRDIAAAAAAGQVEVPVAG
jgi:phosphoribosylamine--glycine ligase